MSSTSNGSAAAAGSSAPRSSAPPPLPPPLPKSEQERIVESLRRTQLQDGRDQTYEDQREQNFSSKFNKIQSRAEELINSPDLLARVERECDEFLAVIKRTNRGSPTLVLDMDCFFASAELRDKPELLGRPVAIVDLGAICTSNYVARKYGVGVMRAQHGKELCRRQGVDLVCLECNYAQYGEASREVQRVLRDDFGFFGDSVGKNPGKIKVPTMDEMILDLSGMVLPSVPPGGGAAGATDPARLVGAAASLATGAGEEDSQDMWARASAFATTVRERIRSRTGMSASGGLGPTEKIAKMCSNVFKPDSQFNCCLDSDHDRLARRERSLAPGTSAYLGLNAQGGLLAADESSSSGRRTGTSSSERTGRTSTAAASKTVGVIDGTPASFDKRCTDNQELNFDKTKYDKSRFLAPTRDAVTDAEAHVEQLLLRRRGDLHDDLGFSAFFPSSML